MILGKDPFCHSLICRILSTSEVKSLERESDDDAVWMDLLCERNLVWSCCGAVLTIKIHSQHHPPASSSDWMVRFRWLDKRANNRGIIVRIKNTMYIKLSPFSIYNEAIICPMSRSFPLLSERHTERDPLRFAFNGPPDHHTRHHTYQGIRRSFREMHLVVAGY